MLEFRFIREQSEAVKENLSKRGLDPTMVDRFLAEDTHRLALLAENEELRNTRNTVSRDIAERKRKKEDAGALIAAMKETSDRIKALDQKLARIQDTMDDLVMNMPNICHETVPYGKDDTENVEERRVGEIPAFAFTPKPHWEVGEKLGILDFARSAKLSGARFALLKGFASRLERALINFMLDLHTQKHGYQEVYPPFLVTAATMTATGQLPKFEEDLFKIKGRDLYLIPTAEVPVTNIHRDETLNEEDLPVKYVAFTPCFRSEAGSYGKDTRGLIRQHQFDKVELVKFTRPEDSALELDRLLADAEEVLQLLELPYRVVTLCSGDLGFSATKTYDIEVWMPAQDTYREISSCSSFTDFQARRGGIRYRPKDGRKSRLVHTINGSGLAVGRTLAAILENCQQQDGTVALPGILAPWFQDRFTSA